MEKKNIIRFLIGYMIFSFINLNGTDLLVRQLIFYVIGICLIMFCKFDLKKLVRPLYIILNVVLLYLLFFGKAINGSKAWIDLPFFSIQPSEFMKIVLIMYLSYIVVRYEKYKLKCFVITLIPSILTFLEPDTGNVIFYFVIMISLLLYREQDKKNVKIFAAGVIVLAVIGVLSFLFLSDYIIKIFGYSFYYRIERVFSLFDNSSYQLNRALIGIGSSYWTGSGSIASIPYETTDFAFSYLISHIGFLGLIGFLVFNFTFDIYCLNNIKMKTGMLKYMMVAFCVMKILQESIHMLMNIGLFPITGITLPFISYGGSSLLSYCLIMAIISNSCHMEHMGKVGMDMELD